MEWITSHSQCFVFYLKILQMICSNISWDKSRIMVSTSFNVEANQLFAGSPTLKKLVCNSIIDFTLALGILFTQTTDCLLSTIIRDRLPFGIDQWDSWSTSPSLLIQKIKIQHFIIHLKTSSSKEWKEERIGMSPLVSGYQQLSQVELGQPPSKTRLNRFKNSLR